MKKHIKAYWVILIAFVVSLVPNLSTKASQVTSYTYTVNEDGYITRTQDAYLPDRTITDLGLSSPDDLYIDQNNMLYIADSGNRRIVKFDITKGTVDRILEYEGFLNPKGVFVTKDGYIYIADPSAKQIFRFDKEMNFVEAFQKPDTPNFVDTPFEPLRVAVDNSNNMYIVGEGVYNGIIQLAYTGEFLGYFTVNQTKLSLVQTIQNALFTREQLANLADKVPTTFSNIFIDASGIVYTTTMGTTDDGLKKHNTAGGNMFRNPVWSSDSLTDVYVDEQGIIYTSIYDGSIMIYSAAGEVIFQFGSNSANLDISGLFSVLPSIAVDQNKNIWAIDGAKGYLQSFKPTDYALMVYEAIDLYEHGLYEEAMNHWNEVLKLNQMSVLAHNGVGKAYLRFGNYEMAMEHFQVAGNRELYSEAFWEVRNAWIQNYLEYIALGIGAIVLFHQVGKRLDKEKRAKRVGEYINHRLTRIAVLRNMKLFFAVPRHPMDSYYHLRVKKQGSLGSATILYFLFFIIFMIYQTGKGFIYQYKAVVDMDINALVIGFFTILILFILCNYLVTSIKDGEGSLKQVYMIPAYGLLPVMVSMIAVIALSYILTYNESFLLTLILYIGITWSAISILLGFLVVHDYTMKELISSILITVIFMIIVAVVALIILIMWEQLWQFLVTFVEEMKRNVFS